MSIKISLKNGRSEQSTNELSAQLVPPRYPIRKARARNNLILLIFLAIPAGFEPATLCLEGKLSAVDHAPNL